MIFAKERGRVYVEEQAHGSADDHAYTRECLALEVDTSFARRRVTRVLDAIVAERGQPQAIRCDNGPELTSRHFLAWCVERQIELIHIQKADAESASRKLSRPLAGRVLGAKLVSELIRCTTENLGVANRVQRGASAQQLGIQDAERNLLRC
jgi:hypothetical protein